MRRSKSSAAVVKGDSIMAKEIKKQGQPQGPKNEGPVVVASCKSDGCKSKPTQFGFCKDHYELYMAGVIRGDGKKPIDYEQKLSLFLKHKKAA
jgi:hypothetical protein